MDFVHDQLATGQRIRVLTVVDTFSRFSPAIDPRSSYRAEDVVATLERVCDTMGYPKTIRVDQGSEFVSRDLDLWAYTRGDRGVCDEAVDEIVGKGDVVALPRRADQAHRIAQGVARGMDFRAQATAGAAKALGIRPLFAGARRPRADALARWWKRSSAIPDRLRAPARQGRRRERPSRSSGSSAASPPRACQTTLAGRASARLTAPSTIARSEIDDCRRADRAYLCVRPARTLPAAPIDRPEAPRHPESSG
jgi:transposase InsO family protein